MKKALKYISAFFVLAVVLTFCRAAAATPPLTAIDTPKSGAAVGNSVTIKGWSICQSGVKSVQIYINGKSVGNAQTGIERDDVNAVYNKSGSYTGAKNSGFSYVLDTSGYAVGTYAVKAVSTSDQGTVYSVSSSFTKPAPKLHLDSPAASKVSASSDVKISGWSLDVTGVKSVSVLLDGKTVGTAQSGISRPDVDKLMNASGAYSGADKSGFSYVLPYSSLPSGSHTVKVVSTGNGSSAVAASFTVTKVPPKPIADIDAASSRLFLEDSLTVKGWSLNPSGVKSVAVYIGSKKIGDATVGLERDDVNKVMNSSGVYKDGEDCGYTFTLADTSAYPVGNYTVKIVSTGNDGTTASASIAAAKLPSSLTVDKPASGASAGGSVEVSGWAVNATGVASVQILLDGTSSGDATLAVSRADVEAMLERNGEASGYPDAATSGFSYDLPLGSVKQGTHTLTVKAVGKDGSSSSVSRSITVTAATASGIAHIEYPVPYNEYIRDNLTVSGWSVSPSGVKSVEVFLNGKSYGMATIGISRPDVAATVNKSNTYLDAENSGFSLTISGLDDYTPGTYTVKVVSTGNDGSQTTTTSTVEKDAPLVGFDSSQYSSSGGTIQVTGWALNATGVNHVDIYSGSTLLGTVTPDEDSTDILTKYDDEGIRYDDASQARFSLSIDSDAFAGGSGTITAIATGNDGETVTAAASVTTGETSSVTYTSYNITAAELASKTGVSLSTVDPQEIESADASGMYEFMNLGYVDGITADELNEMLQGEGVLEGQGQAFLDAAKANDLNPVYLAAHAMLESGGGTSTLSKGVQVPAGTYTFNGKAETVAAGTYYNQFGINAIDANPTVQGSEYAAYSGWNTVAASIEGGAEWISSVYVWGGSPDQDTLYKMRFDPGYWDGTYPHCYEYATSTTWAHSIAQIIERYSSFFDGLPITFNVPQYE